MFSVVLGTETNVDNEPTSTQGISEERDVMLSHGLQKNVVQGTNFLETCEPQKHQEIPTVKNIKEKVPRIHCARKTFRLFGYGSSSHFILFFPQNCLKLDLKIKSR